MSPFLRKSKDKAAQEAAGDAELERLTALSGAELAAEIMPVYGPDGPGGSGGTKTVQVAQWLMASYPRRPGLKPLLIPVQNATKTLADAGLVEQTMSGIGTGVVSAKATPLGEQALAEKAVLRYLGVPGR